VKKNKEKKVKKNLSIVAKDEYRPPANVAIRSNDYFFAASKHPMGVYLVDNPEVGDFDILCSQESETIVNFYNDFSSEENCCNNREENPEDCDVYDAWNDDSLDRLDMTEGKQDIIISKFINPLTFMSRKVFDVMKNRGRKVKMGTWSTQKENRLQRNIKNAAYKAYKKKGKERQIRLAKLVKAREALTIRPHKNVKAPATMAA